MRGISLHSLAQLVLLLLLNLLSRRFFLPILTEKVPFLLAFRFPINKFPSFLLPEIHLMRLANSFLVETLMGWIVGGLIIRGRRRRRNLQSQRASHSPCPVISNDECCFLLPFLPVRQASTTTALPPLRFPSGYGDLGRVLKVFQTQNRIWPINIYGRRV